MIGIRRRLVTVAEAASILGVSKRTIRRWIQAGRLASIRIGSRVVRIPIELAPAGIEITPETFGFGTGKTMRLPADFLFTGAKAVPVEHTPFAARIRLGQIDRLRAGVCIACGEELPCPNQWNEGGAPIRGTHSPPPEELLEELGVELMKRDGSESS